MFYFLRHNCNNKKINDFNNKNKNKNKKQKKSILISLDNCIVM